MKTITMRYTNWRGNTAIRTVIPIGIWFGSTEYHPEPQTLMTAFDVNKGEVRDFAVSDCEFGVGPTKIE